MHEVLPPAKLDELASVETTSTEVKPRAMGGSVQTEGVEQILQATARCDREIAAILHYLTTGEVPYGYVVLNPDPEGALMGLGDWHLERDLLTDELERRRSTTRT
jgi:hypothetical protein